MLRVVAGATAFHRYRRERGVVVVADGATTKASPLPCVHENCLFIVDLGRFDGYSPFGSVPTVASLRGRRLLSVTRSRMRGRSNRRPTTSAMRSPEMSIPRMIATPKTTLRQAPSRAENAQHLVENVTKNAATHVDARAGQPARQRGAAEHDCGDRAEEVGRTGIDAWA